MGHNVLGVGQFELRMSFILVSTKNKHVDNQITPRNLSTLLICFVVNFPTLDHT